MQAQRVLHVSDLRGASILDLLMGQTRLTYDGGETPGGPRTVDVVVIGE